jgi:hypothetical protein
VTPSSRQQLEWLHESEDSIGLDFIERVAIGKTSKVMVPPENSDLFAGSLKSMEIESYLIFDNAEEILEKERKIQMIRRNLQLVSGERNFEHYWTYEEFESYLEELANDYPNLVQKELIGQSIEGRNINALRISTNLDNFGKKPIVFINSGIHAREWVAHMSTIYLVHQLVERSADNSVLLGVDWFIIPILNPDGYVYSMNFDRMWRKNRRVGSRNCVGIDLNRNMPFAYKTSSLCSSTGYPGPNALSEPETKALNDALLSNRNNLILYLDVHSCGSMALYPWGYTYPPLLTPNTEEHHELGLKFSDAVKKATGEGFIVGNSAEILYTANGATDDFAMSIGARLGYTLELPCGGNKEFNYPESQIGSLVRGMFPGFAAMGKYIAETYN